MRKLIPENLRDNNGRLVTPHVNTDGGSDVRAPLPAVSTPKDAAIAMIVKVLRDNFAGKIVMECRNYLEDCRESTLVMVSEAIRGLDSTVKLQVISMAARKKHEDFLRTVATSASAWSPLASSLTASDGEIPFGPLSDLDREMFALYKDMFTPDPLTDHAAVRFARMDFGIEEENSESFVLELLGSKLRLSAHHSTNRAYYRDLELLDADREGVAVILPELLKINSSMDVRDKYGNVVITPLTAGEVMAVVGLSREYPGRIKETTEFITERKAFDEQVVREFLAAERTPLTRGVL